MNNKRMAKELVKIAKGLVSEIIIDSRTLDKAMSTIEEAKRIVSVEMPKANFVLKGISDKFIYFNVVCKLHETDEDEMEDIVAKTRFYVINITDSPIYVGEFKMRIF